MTISLVEDEKSLLEVIQLNLEMEGNTVYSYSNGKDAFSEIEKITKTDLLILDVMLPGLNGIELCSKIRKVSNIPILILSAKGTTTDRITGLKSGANDYLPKPFDLEELLLRVNNLLQKSSVSVLSSSVKIGDKTVHFENYTIVDDNTQSVISISKREIDLLRFFVSREDQVISRNDILDEIWGRDQFPTSRTIDNYILNFRKIFEKDQKNPRHFHSIRGVGYKFQN